MPEVDVVDATWIGVRPIALARVVADPANWARWWPELTLTVHQLRREKGVRWLVPTGVAGAVSGSMEIWLQDVDDGTVVHYFLRLDGRKRPLGRRRRIRLEHDYRTRMKRVFWDLADRLDPGRLARLAGPPTRIP